MASDPLAAVPVKFKALQHYIKTAAEHEKRDPAVTYYCRLYAMQKGMEIDRKSPECRSYLQVLMNTLEQMKVQNKENEAMQNEVVGQAHLENHALKLFLYADTEDRAGRFGKNVVKSFYTAGMLMDVLATFGELTEEIEKNRKYAKWKAAYIHSCLKNGETPHAGPMGDDEMGEFGEDSAAGGGTHDQFAPTTTSGGDASGFSQPPNAAYGFTQPGAAGGYNQPTTSGYNQPNIGGYGQPNPFMYNNTNDPSNHLPPIAAPRQPTPTMPAAAPPAVQPPSAEPARYQQPAALGGVKLKPEDYTKAMKFCKFATSALQYEDAKTAVENLAKAMNLLTTGHE